MCAACERRYDCVYEGIDVEQYTAQLIGKMKKWGSFGVVRNRSTLASQVVCERFELVVLVFSRWILPHTSLSLSQWFVTILNGVLEPLKQAQECEKLLLVARPILATFVEGGENPDNTSQCLDALAAQIPFLFSHIASADKEQIASVFTFLLTLRPSLFESLRELFVASLSTLQSPATPAVFGSLLHEGPVPCGGVRDAEAEHRASADDLQHGDGARRVAAPRAHGANHAVPGPQPVRAAALR